MLKFVFLFWCSLSLLHLDIFLPCPENLLVNLHEERDLVRDLLVELPEKFSGNPEPSSALGAALQASYKLMVVFLRNISHFVAHR